VASWIELGSDVYLQNALVDSACVALST